MYALYVFAYMRVCVLVFVCERVSVCAFCTQLADINRCYPQLPLSRPLLPCPLLSALTSLPSPPARPPATLDELKAVLGTVNTIRHEGMAMELRYCDLEERYRTRVLYAFTPEESTACQQELTEAEVSGRAGRRRQRRVQ